jgi:hypothetical protein
MNIQCKKKTNNKLFDYMKKRERGRESAASD